MKHLIINADDFGYSQHVNSAVIRAHREGVLTSASLMVTEPGWPEAVELARRTPSLGVGLHVTVTYDHALLPPKEIPDIVNAQGTLGSNPFHLGLKYALNKAAKAQLRREMEAQFVRFADTGLDWSHVDGHQHFHMHLYIWEVLLDLCDQYGVHRLRIPHEEMRAHFAPRPPARGDGPNLNTLAIVFHRLMRRRNLRLLRARRTLGGKPIFVCDRVYGQLQSGNMHTAYTLALLDRLHAPTNEIYFHPGTEYARALPPEQQSDHVHDVEMQTLLSPAVRDRIEALDLRLGTYAQVEAALAHNSAAVGTMLLPNE